MAYADLEPFGERHRDTHFGILGATLANCHRGEKNKKPFTPDQFRIRTELDVPRKKAVGGRSILDIFRSIKNGD